MKKALIILNPQKDFFTERSDFNHNVPNNINHLYHHFIDNDIVVTSRQLYCTGHPILETNPKCAINTPGSKFSTKFKLDGVKKFVNKIDKDEEVNNSAFQSMTDKYQWLADYLRENDVEEIYIVGATKTHVLETAIDGVAEGFNVNVILYGITIDSLDDLSIITNELQDKNIKYYESPDSFYAQNYFATNVPFATPITGTVSTHNGRIYPDSIAP